MYSKLNSLVQLPGIVLLIGIRRSIVRLCLDSSLNFRNYSQNGVRVFPESMQTAVSVPKNWKVVSELPICILALDGQQLAVLGTEAVPWRDRVISAIYYMCPYARRFISEHYTVDSYEAVATMH